MTLPLGVAQLDHDALKQNLRIIEIASVRCRR